jgi:hypothetical protein
MVGSTKKRVKIERASDLPSPARKKIKLVRTRVIHAMTLWKFKEFAKKHEKLRDSLNHTFRFSTNIFSKIQNFVILLSSSQTIQDRN